MSQTDVLIIGGGLAGTYLAYLLDQQNIDYQLLEAKPELGGRIISKTSSAQQDSNLHIDLGPTWFWPHQQQIQNLLKELNLSYFEQYIEGSALYQIAPNAPIQKTHSGEGMLSYRICHGMQSLIQHLEQHLDKTKLHLSQPANKINKHSQGWQITTATQKVFSGKQLVIAIPPRVFINHFTMTDYLPAELIQQLTSTPTWMAAQAKFVASYKNAFWREAGLSGDAFSRVGPMVEIHDASADIDAGYALFGFLGIPAASRLQLENQALEQLCLAQLAAIFGPDALEVETSYLHDWAKDNYVCTAADINGPALHPSLSLASYSQALAEMQLHFAGTEYATMEAGYLEGALISAKAVYQQLSKTL